MLHEGSFTRKWAHEQGLETASSLVMKVMNLFTEEREKTGELPMMDVLLSLLLSTHMVLMAMFSGAFNDKSVEKVEAAKASASLSSMARHVVGEVAGDAFVATLAMWVESTNASNKAWQELMKTYDVTCLEQSSEVKVVEIDMNDLMSQVRAEVDERQKKAEKKASEDTESYIK